MMMNEDRKSICSTSSPIHTSSDSGKDFSFSETDVSRDLTEEEHEGDESVCSNTSSDTSSVKQLNLSHMLQVMKERLNATPEKTSSRKYLLNTSLLSYSSTDLEDSLSDLNSSTGDGFEQFYKHHRFKEIQHELKLMSTNHQDGVYVMPSLKSIEMWFGVIFVRDGPYKDGIFHFTVYFSDDFPDDRPTFKFKSQVFHPQVKTVKGTLNLNPVYDKAKGNRVRVWELVKYARSCFYHLNVVDAYNKEAAVIFESDLKTFKARCRSSVLDSLLEFEEQKHAFDYQSENPFRSSIVEDGLCDAIKTALVSSEQGYGSKNGIFGWAKSQIGKVLNNINAYSSVNEGSDNQENLEQII